MLKLDIRSSSTAAAFPDRQSGGGEHRPAVDGAVCAAMAYRTDAAADGSLGSGTEEPRRGLRSHPCLANLFLHYAFDHWMARTFPAVKFERFVDDAVVHCGIERQALTLRSRDRAADGAGRAGSHPPRPRSCIARTVTGGAGMTGLVRLPGIHLPPAQGAVTSRRGGVHLVPARDEPGKADRKGPRGPPLAAPSAHQRLAGRPRRSDQPDRARLDELLGPFGQSEMYPLLNASTPTWCDGRDEIPTATRFQRVKAWWQGVVKRDPNLSPTGAGTWGFLPTGW